MNSTSRRRFLKISGSSAVTLLAGGAVGAVADSDAGSEKSADLKPTIARTRQVMIDDPNKNLWTLHQSKTSRTNLVRMRGKGNRHFHPDAEHSLFVISGKLTAHVDEESIALAAGDYISIPAGVAHGYDVVGDEPALLLSMDAPAYDPSKTVRVQGQ